MNLDEIISDFNTHRIIGGIIINYGAHANASKYTYNCAVCTDISIIPIFVLRQFKKYVQLFNLTTTREVPYL